MWLLIVAIVGLIIGDGLFLYWLLYDSPSLSQVLEDRLALAFMVDAAIP
jgi:hypothetical protein